MAKQVETVQRAGSNQERFRLNEEACIKHHLPRCANVPNRSMRFLAFGLIGLLWPAAALSQAATPSELMKADQTAYNELVAVFKNREFIGAKDQVFIRRIAFHENAFLISRIENQSCAGEFCPTVIISDKGEPKIIGLGWFPKKMTFSDVIYNLCDACDEAVSVSFVDNTGNETTFGLTKDYILLNRTRGR